VATNSAALVAQGFVQLESHIIVMPPMAHAGSLLARKRPVISLDPAAVRPKLSDQQKRIFDDHAPYDCLQLLVEEGEERAYVVVKRRVQRPMRGTRLGRLAKLLPVRFADSDILHCSSPELLARHLERAKLAILRRQRTAALAAEARLFPVRPRGMLVPRPHLLPFAPAAAGRCRPAAFGIRPSAHLTVREASSSVRFAIGSRSQLGGSYRSRRTSCSYLASGESR
jgi:acetoacetyl-CoA synthetase